MQSLFLHKWILPSTEEDGPGIHIQFLKYNCVEGNREEEGCDQGVLTRSLAPQREEQLTQHLKTAKE